MNHCHSALLLVVLMQPAVALAGGDATAPAPTRPVATVRSTITADAVRADVAALSSDEMGGRFFRSPFAEKAAVWITEQFKTIGLAPGMPDGARNTASSDSAFTRNRPPIARMASGNRRGRGILIARPSPRQGRWRAAGRARPGSAAPGRARPRAEWPAVAAVRRRQ